jgi:hypothetical protein
MSSFPMILTSILFFIKKINPKRLFIGIKIKNEVIGSWESYAITKYYL